MQTNQKEVCPRLLPSLVGLHDTLVRLQHWAGWKLHGIFDAQDALFSLFFHRREIQSVLSREQIENRRWLQASGDYICESIGHDNGNDNGVISADFQHHE